MNKCFTHLWRILPPGDWPVGRIGWLPAALLVGWLVLAPSAPGQAVSPVLEPYAEQVERAIEGAFQYFVATQNENGYFPGEYGGSAGVVSLVGMSFLAAGHTPGHGAYGEVVNRCLDYVLAQQNREGYIYASEARSDRGMYSHHIATLFLAEVSGMVDPRREEKVRGALARAVRVIIAAQEVDKRSGHEGGWRYGPSVNDSDLSVSGWAIMALRSARLNGARVPDENIRRAIEYVLRMQHENGGFGYQRPGQHRPSLTGLAILCLALTGHHDGEPVERARRYLEDTYQRLANDQFALYGVYYATQAAFQLGGRTWESVGDWLYRTYLPKQRDDGSWGADVGGRHGSERNTAVYNTALVVLSLTVPYRQLPIYQRDETVDE